jgi:hypothetical protein
VGPREAHACHDYILPRLRDAGWRDEHVIEQHYFRDGRIGRRCAAIGASLGSRPVACSRSNLAFRSRSSKPNADGYTSALAGAHYFVLSTELLRGVIEPVN